MWNPAENQSKTVHERTAARPGGVVDRFCLPGTGSSIHTHTVPLACDDFALSLPFGFLPFLPPFPFRRPILPWHRHQKVKSAPRSRSAHHLHLQLCSCPCSGTFRSLAAFRTCFLAAKKEGNNERTRTEKNEAQTRRRRKRKVPLSGAGSPHFVILPFCLFVVLSQRLSAAPFPYSTFFISPFFAPRRAFSAFSASLYLCILHLGHSFALVHKTPATLYFFVSTLSPRYHLRRPLSFRSLCRVPLVCLLFGRKTRRLRLFSFLLHPRYHYAARTERHHDINPIRLRRHHSTPPLAHSTAAAALSIQTSYGEPPQR